LIENSTQGLTLLDPDHKVVVTGEEHHQSTLVRWAPHPDGRGRRVAAELGFVTGPRGRRLIEVRIDGQRVGVLTPLMSERYAPHVHEVLRGRGRPACVAVVVPGRRGIEVEVHLPEVARDATEALPVTPVPVPPPRPAPPAGAGAWPPPGGSGGWPAPAPAGGGWPGNRPGPGSPGPGPDGRSPDGRSPGGRGPGGRGPGRARRSRRPLWVGAGVLAALVVIGSTMSNHSGEVPTVSAAAPSTTRSAPTPTTVPAPAAPTTVPAPTVVEEVEQVDVAVPDVDAPEVAPQAAARVPETRRTQERAPEPEPEPERQVVEEPEAATEVYYANCAAVRAAGAAPIRVGEPGYRRGLDSDGDGQGCGAD
jgi:hypothetical protein